MKTRTCLLVILLLCVTITLPIVRASPQKPKIYVDPDTNTFSTETTSVGTEFIVSVKTADWDEPGVFSYEFKLCYDNTMLEAVGAEIPEGHWLSPSQSAYNIFIVDGGTINNTGGVVSFAATLLGDELGKTGGGTLSTITFKITQAPSSGQNFSCTLELLAGDVILVNPSATEIPPDQYDIVNGDYLYFTPAGPPPEKPLILVDPKENAFYTTTTPVGADFTVSIKAANWEDPGVFSYEFKLYYDNTMLEAVGAEIPSDHWLKPSLAPTNISIVDAGTINQTEGLVSFAASLIGDELGKTGNGTIATVTLKIIATPPADQNFSCTLELLASDVILVDPSAIEIPPDSYGIVNGYFLYSSITAGIKEDLNDDGTVNIDDIAIWGLAFGSYPGHDRWNSRADINEDSKVNMIDGVLIAKVFRVG